MTGRMLKMSVVALAFLVTTSPAWAARCPWGSEISTSARRTPSRSQSLAAARWDTTASGPPHSTAPRSDCCQPRGTPESAPSHEGSMPLEVLYATGSRGTSGSPLPPQARPFDRTSAVSLRPPSTQSLRPRFHPPASFAPPPEYCDVRPAPHAWKSLATKPIG